MTNGADLARRLEEAEELIREEVALHKKWLSEGKLSDNGRAMDWNCRAEAFLNRDGTRGLP